MHTLVHKIYMITTLVVFLLGPLLFIVFVYVKVCIEMKKMHDKEKSLTPTRSLFPSTRKTKKGTKYQCVKSLQGINNKCKLKEKTLKLFYSVARSKPHTENDLPFCQQSNRSAELFLTEASPEVKVRQSTVLMLDSEAVMSIIATESNNASKEKINAMGRPDNLSGITKCYKGDNDVDTVSVKSPQSSFDYNEGILIGHSRVCKVTQMMKRKAYENKASLAFLIVAITYMFTWLPVITLTFDEVLNHPIHLPRSLKVISLYAIALNALSDTFVYGLLLPDFRKTLKLSLRTLKARII